MQEGGQKLNFFQRADLCVVLVAPRVIDFVRSVHPVQPASPAPTALPTSSSTHRDPLEGEWRQVATCQGLIQRPAMPA